MANPQEFKWFGEGFDGFPKQIAEDCVEYSLFLLDLELSEEDVAARLDEVLKASEDFRPEYLKNYIWQREGLSLQQETEADLTFLRGRTHYGDSIEDEWLVVFLVRRLSEKFPDLWVKLEDNDGDFLLIEAARVLPNWLEPSTGRNRLWLHQGHLYLISRDAPVVSKQADAAAQRALSLSDAFAVLRSKPEAVRPAAEIEAEAFYRLRNYPDQIARNSHRALVKIPRILAYVLREQPALISPAVEAFYLRDPIAMQTLREPNPGGSSAVRFPPKDLVTVAITFTKVGYAQIQSQQFPPPTIWEPVLPASDDELFKAADTGMKLSCAFEMLLADAQNNESETVKRIQSLLESTRTGTSALPSDDEIATWGDTAEDESWLDVDFADFERELSGNKEAASSNKSGSAPTFSDDATQANLRKMVERFENFLNDDTAGPDGAEMGDGMDEDDEDELDNSSDASSSGEDKDISFDEAEFARMMREMMGMPPEESEATKENGPMKPATTAEALMKGNPLPARRVEEVNSDSDGAEEGADLRKEMQAIEAELSAAGALQLDPPARAQIRGTKGARVKLGQANAAEEDESDENADASVDLDFNLAKNLLESFKSQGGLAGPGGNMLGMLGMQLPRDEEDGDAGGGKGKAIDR